MTANARAESTTDQRDVSTMGCYVYGIVDADVEVLPETRGVGDPPAAVDVLRVGDIAALVSDVDTARALGRPDDLIAHESLLDAAIVDAPVLPIRFGAVLTDREAVAEELLEAHHDEFASALREISGRVQYVVRARYEEGPLLAEVLAENPDAADLARRLRDRPAEEDLGQRQQLGEIVASAVEAKRDADAAALADALSGVCIATSVRPPTHEEDAAHLAVLVDTAHDREFQDALATIARDWEGRARIRLLGPMAPYDFVVTARSSEES
jgi:hypothetical protein